MSHKKYLIAHTPKNKYFEDSIESKLCCFCGIQIINEYEVPLIKKQYNIPVCYLCFNVSNIGVVRNMFVIAISEMKQYDIIIKTHEIIKAKNLIVSPPNIIDIDPNALLVSLSDVEYSFIIKALITNKIKKNMFIKKIKLFVNSKGFDPSKYFNKRIVKSNLISIDITKGLQHYIFSDEEKVFLNKCLYSVPTKQVSDSIDIIEMIDTINNLNIKNLPF